jgi:hypothetical protein
VLEQSIRLLPLGRREVLGGGTLGPAPVALGDVECAADDARVDVAVGCVDEVGLGLDDGAGAALVVDAEDLGAGLELAAGGGGGEGLVEFDLPLAVDDAAGVELGDAGDLGGLLVGVEVDYLLRVLLERCVNLPLAVVLGSDGWQEGVAPYEG